MSERWSTKKLKAARQAQIARGEQPIPNVRYDPPKLAAAKTYECSHGVHWLTCKVCSKPKR